MNVSTNWISDNGTSIDSYTFQTFVHELGHALGLGHQGNYNGNATYGIDNTFSNDSWAMSIMSYFDQDDNSQTAATYARLSGPMLADIVAIQELYGSSTTTSGNTVYGRGSNLGGYIEALFDTIASGRTNSIYTGDPMAFAIYDSGGIDTINLSFANTDNRIDLRAEAFSDIHGGVHNLSIARGTVIENVTSSNGNDTIQGNAANNTIRAGGGNDSIYTRDGNDTVFTDDGSDTVYSGNGNDVLRGSDGNDQLWAGAGNDTLYGGNNNDAIGGGNGNDSVYGGNGNDSLYGGNGIDRLYGETGDDELWTGAGSDFVNAGTGNDQLGGGLGNDYLWGDTGNDLVYGGAGVDTVQAGDGADTVYGGDDNDRIFGANGADQLFGANGNDYLHGGAGNDTLIAGDGNDVVLGAFGDDMMTGGTGADRFIFIGGRDTITDFNAFSAAERIDLRSFAPITNYADLTANHLVTQGGNTVINGSAGSTLTLLGVSITDLDASDFIF